MRQSLASWFCAALLFLPCGTARAQDKGKADPARNKSTLDELKINWPAFRGFRSNGLASSAAPPTTWSVKTGKNILWKTAISKHGMSSPVVWQDRVYLTGADDQSRDVLCYDASDGDLLWTHSVSDLPGAPAEGILPRVLDETGYAAPTMATNGKEIATIFATGELVCLTMEGKRIWAKQLEVPKNHYGHASSLICTDQLLFVQYDQQKGSKLFAFKMATGEPAWEADRDEMAWSSPILIDNEGRSELVLTDSKYVASYDPKTGKRLWRVECFSGEVASSAAFADGLLFVANEGAAASAVDVSSHTEGPKIVWRWDGDLPDAASPVANEDFLIVPTAFGVITCLDTKTGKVHWERVFDLGFNSSPVLVDDRVYISDLSGDTHVFELGEKFESIGSGDVQEPVYATPAFVGERIFIRGLFHLFCVGKSP